MPGNRYYSGTNIDVSWGERWFCSEKEAVAAGEDLTVHAVLSAAIDDALAAFPDNMAVKVAASGSQYSPNNDGKFVNSLNVSIEPVHGFVS
jgi:hypothetical protein